MFKNFFDRFKSKHDGTKHPCLAAMDFFRPKLSAWNPNDEYRLSLRCEHESSFGWGSLDLLGIAYSHEGRPLLAYACTHRAGYGSGDFQMQAETLGEAFTFIMRNNSFVEVYYLNHPIGSITPDFFAHDLNGVVVMKCTPSNASQGVGVVHSAIGPAPFEFASGLRGWYNIPPRGNYPADRLEFSTCRAIGIHKNSSPHDYERRWMIAMWIFLRVGPWTREEWPEGIFENFWDDILIDIFLPDLR
jgi:hypothetical protein